MPVLGDAEDPLRLGLERRLPEPRDAGAVAEQLRPREQALGHATLVIRLAERAPRREHDRDAQGRGGGPADVRAQRRDLSQALVVTDHDEMPGLAVLGATRPARELQELVDDLIGHGIGRVLADLRDPADRVER